MSFILSKTEGQVLHITLNRPDKFNSFNREMALQLIAELDSASENKSIRAVLISGNGKAFCAGQDLAEAMDKNGPGIERIVHEHYNPIILRLRKLQKPVVCAVNGVAAGAGANIALACDVVISAKSAAFIQAFSKIGLIPDSGGTYFLPKLIGFGKASALMMLGDKVMAEEAEKLGMIYKVCDDEKLMEVASQTANTLAGMPTRGIGLTKKLLNEGFVNDLEKQLQREKEEQVIAASTYDYNEGVTAFLEKRQPVFKGE
jgi:2-(1,2-epoxy-1,2-dihydrophenyl)acetyl-CoA isomerase